MLSCEKFYKNVMKYGDNFRAELRKRSIIVVKIIALVCGIAAVLVSVSAANRHVSIEENVSQAGTRYAAESVMFSSTAQFAVLDVPEKTFNNTLNIGKVEVFEDDFSFFVVGMFQEKTREETLLHFGLSPNLDLSRVVEDIREVSPPETITGAKGKYGYTIDIAYDGNTEMEWAVDPRYDHQLVRFENTDGSKWINVAFCHTEYVPWWINGGIDRSQTDKLSISKVAGVQMHIGERNNGGYYAEFDTKTLCVGMTIVGCTEDEMVEVLEYLARYVEVSS